MPRSSATLDALADIRELCQRARALAHAQRLPDLPASAELRGERAWHPHEHTAWGLGESVRQLFKRAGSLKRDAALVAEVAAIAELASLGRGRQSFVMAIGFTAAAPVAPRLAPLLADQEVAGHVVHTLLRMRAPGYGARVAPLAKADRTWVRRKASEYIQRFGAAV